MDSASAGFTLVTPSGNRIAGESTFDGLFLNEVLNLDVTKQNWVRFTTEETTGTFELLWKGSPTVATEVAEASFTLA